MKIILDTSFIVNAVKFKLDFRKEFKGHKLLLIPTVLNELYELSQGGGSDAVHAKVGLKIIKDLETIFEPEKFAGDVDGALLQLSKEGYVIATQDMPLRAAIKEAGGKVAFIRQKKKIVIE